MQFRCFGESRMSSGEQCWITERSQFSASAAAAAADRQPARCLEMNHLGEAGKYREEIRVPSKLGREAETESCRGI